MESGLIIKDEPFPFLRLPAEIRNQVYEYTFTIPVSDEVVAWAYPNKTSHWLQPLLTCRAIYKEAGLLAFSRVSFVSDYNTALPWEKLSPEQTQSIRSVTLKSPKFGNVLNLRQMASLGLMETPPTCALEEVRFCAAWDLDLDNPYSWWPQTPPGSLPRVFLRVLEHLPSLKRLVFYGKEAAIREAVEKIEPLVNCEDSKLTLRLHWPSPPAGREVVDADMLYRETGEMAIKLHFRKSVVYDQGPEAV